MIYAKFRDFQSFLCKYDAFHAFSRHICRIIADVTATCETLQYGITWISRNTHESFAIGMQLRYKRSIYDVAVLTSDSQHGTVGRIELQDAQGLVLRPFLEAAVQLELHDPRRPGLTRFVLLTPYSRAAPLLLASHNESSCDGNVLSRRCYCYVNTTRGRSTTLFTLLRVHRYHQMIHPTRALIRMCVFYGKHAHVLSFSSHRLSFSFSLTRFAHGLRIIGHVKQRSRQSASVYLEVFFFTRSTCARKTR